jgi:hypothetical protein
MCRRHESSADGCSAVVAKKRLVSRTAPSLKLRGTASDVAEEQAAVVELEGLQHPEVDQAGLLDPGHDLDVDAGFPASPVQELVTVLGLAHGAGRDGSHRRTVAVGDASEPAQRLDGAVDRIRRQLLHLRGPRTEPDHLLLAGEDLEPVAVGGASHHEVERVRPDVDSSKGVRHCAEASGAQVTCCAGACARRLRR